MNSSLCSLLGIQYPIMQGAFQWLATPELAAAVSNAGGLGTISASLYQTKEELTEAIARAKSLTDKPFCVNISMFPEVVEGEKTWDFIAACCQSQVPVVELSGRDPKPFVEELHGAGAKIIHKSTAVRFAQKAEAAGVDVVSVVGFECGGAPGNDDVTSMVLIPSVASAVHIPVIGGGGVCDGRWEQRAWSSGQGSWLRRSAPSIPTLRNFWWTAMSARQWWCSGPLISPIEI